MSICLQIHSFLVKPFPVEHGDPVGLYPSLVETSSSVPNRRVLSKGVHIHVGHVYLRLTAIGVRTWWIKKTHIARCQRATIGNNRFANSKQLMFFWNNNQLESQLASGKIVSKRMTASLSLRPAAPFADLSTGHVSRLEMDEGIQGSGNYQQKWCARIQLSNRCRKNMHIICIYKDNMDMNISWRQESMFEIRNSAMGILFWMDVQVLIFIVSWFDSLGPHVEWWIGTLLGVRL